jgi:predicted N-formylglutamate amidohydrolase
VYSTTSRLLVELNRSPHHRQIFSEVTRALPLDERRKLLERYYFPYREGVETRVHDAADLKERVVHVSCHSFTPRLDGEERRADVGLLYDPKRAAEVDFCSAWQKALRSEDPRLVVRRNYPYRGYADGLTTSLRRRYPDPAYAGIELEVNQKYPLGDAGTWRAMRKTLVRTLEQTFAP